MSLLKSIQHAVPIQSRFSLVAHMVGTGALFAPRVGFIPRVCNDLVGVNLLPEPVANAVPWIVGGSLSLFYGAKAMELFAPSKQRGIWVGDMFYPEKALWTSFMSTGRPGSGKTSGVLMPMTEQLFDLFNGPDYVMKDGKMVENSMARIGGLVCEQKGEFYEMIGYLMDSPEIGRNVFEDYLIIRPDSDIPVAQFEDVDTGNLFYVNALPCASGSDAGRLLMAAQANVKEDARIAPDIYSALPRVISDNLPTLRSLEYQVDDDEIIFLGWRRENGKLVRVSHTPEYRKPAFLLDGDGNKQYVPIPKKLKFRDRLLFSNGLVYNFVDPNLNPNEAAKKLVRMAEMSGRGEKQGGDNSFWTTNAQKLIASIIALQRALHPQEVCHCGHVQKFVADATALGAGVRELHKLITSRKMEMERVTDPYKKSEIADLEIRPLEVLHTYLDKEWAGLDEKPKSTIISVVSNTFSIFVSEAALFRTFCQQPSFHLKETMQKGRVFAFVPGPQFMNLSKEIGAGLKLDAQANWLARINRADYNKERPQILLIDECWNWVMAGGSGGGDPYFLSMCRQARVINLLATQSYVQFDSAIGRDNANAYLSNFGAFIWLQSTDARTNDHAEHMMALQKRETFTANDREGQASVQQKWEETRAFRAGDFVGLEGDEAIAFNAYRNYDLAIKTKLPKSRLTHPDEQPKIAKFMRLFLAGSIEQALWRQNRVDRLNPGPGRVEPAAKKPAAASPVAPAASPATPEAKPTVQPNQTNYSPDKVRAPLPSTPNPASPKADTGPATANEIAKSDPKSAEETKRIPPPLGSARKLNYNLTYSNLKPNLKPVAAPTKVELPPIKPVGAPQAEVPPQRSVTVPERPIPKAKPEQGPLLTPSIVDQQSTEFVEKWNRLSVAATEVSLGDEHGFAQWVQTLESQVRENPKATTNLLPGPHGHSVGAPELSDKVDPFPVNVDQLDQLISRRALVRDAQIQKTTELEFSTQSSGLPAEKVSAMFDGD